MKLFINGTGCISPQPTFDSSVFLKEVKEYTTNRLTCVDPNYNSFFDAGSIRRMGPLLKFGTAAGLLAIKDSGISVPGAISTGTGLGLPEISQKFLRSVIEFDETIVSPTAFIQSTHNTVSSNIALLCGCHGHNNTFSHKGFSFESALTDAQMLAIENVDNILLGAYDEVSDYKYAAMKFMNELRNEPCSNLESLNQPGHGIIAGQGAAFFVLSKNANEHTYGALGDNRTFYKPESADEIKLRIQQFIKDNNLSIEDIDVVISGISGDEERDHDMTQINADLFKEQTIAGYKHLCGEYMTSSGFAFWLAAQMMKTKQIPEAVVLKNRGRKPENILLYNSFRHNHSLMLFSHV